MWPVFSEAVLRWAAAFSTADSSDCLPVAGRFPVCPRSKTHQHEGPTKKNRWFFLYLWQCFPSTLWTTWFKRLLIERQCSSVVDCANLYTGKYRRPRCGSNWWSCAEHTEYFELSVINLLQVLPWSLVVHHQNSLHQPAIYSDGKTAVIFYAQSLLGQNSSQKFLKGTGGSIQQPSPEFLPPSLQEPSRGRCISNRLVISKSNMEEK